MAGLDVRIHPESEVKYLREWGNHVSIDRWVYCSTQLYVGDWVHIAPHVSIIGGQKSTLRIGNFSGISTGARIICGSENFVNSLCGFMPDEYKQTTYGAKVMEDYSWVGAGAIIMPNIRIAEGSVIGAGAVLTKDTEPWMVYQGVPAKSVKRRDMEGILYNAKRLIKDYESKSKASLPF